MSEPLATLGDGARPAPAEAPAKRPITLGSFRASEQARRYVTQVLDSGRLTYGPFSRRLEERFAALHDARFGVVSNSGTAALQMALAALGERHGWRAGDEVVIPAVTFIATANVVLHNGLRPVLADVEPRSYGLDAEAFERAVGPRTRAVIPVHLFGQPCDMDPIREVARRHDLRVVEDSCETMLARYRGEPCGSMGEIGCFSTYAAHLLVTGVGGINITSDPELAAMLRSLANHGRDGAYLSIDDDDGLDPERLREVVERRFRFVRPGHSNRITELEAALGVAGLEQLPADIAQRRRNAARLTQRLRPLEDVLQLPEVRDDREHAFMMYPLVLRAQPKQELVAHLEICGVETRDMMPLIDQPALRERVEMRPGAYPVAEWIHHGGFYVGCHQGLGAPEMDRLAELLLDWFGRA